MSDVSALVKLLQLRLLRIVAAEIMDFHLFALGVHLTGLLDCLDVLFGIVSRLNALSSQSIPPTADWIQSLFDLAATSTTLHIPLKIHLRAVYVHLPTFSFFSSRSIDASHVWHRERRHECHLCLMDLKDAPLAASTPCDFSKAAVRKSIFRHSWGISGDSSSQMG